MHHPTLIPVADASAAALADAGAIGAGTPSRALMQRAGAAAAAEIARRHAEHLGGGVVVVTGSGNNGGDGWVIARALHAVGIAVRVVECVAARSPDAIAERTLAVNDGVGVSTDIASMRAGGEPIVVDAVLGTGFSAGAPLRESVALAVEALRALASEGRVLVGIDLPSGLDASSGASEGAAPCDITITFGSIKRGHLVARDLCGAIVVVDIGLGVHAMTRAQPVLASAAWFRAMLPRIPASAHKGTRGKVVVIGGAAGMAGATILAARAALRSGAGMIKCAVAPESLLALQEAEPAALSMSWPTSDAQFDEGIGGWADAILVGPGLGSHDTRAMVERVLRRFAGPVVLDADALNAFADDIDALLPLVGSRAALLTPHPAEFARLLGETTQRVLDDRFEMPAVAALRSGTTVLLKGVPTIITAPSGSTMVVAEGTPVLGTGGSGDMLGGIAITLLAQCGDALMAGALAAFAHGRAAAAVSARQVRGYTLDDVVGALPLVWGLSAATPRPPILCELPAVGESG